MLLYPLFFKDLLRKQGLFVPVNHKEVDASCLLSADNNLPLTRIRKYLEFLKSAG